MRLPSRRFLAGRPPMVVLAAVVVGIAGCTGTTEPPPAAPSTSVPHGPTTSASPAPTSSATASVRPSPTPTSAPIAIGVGMARITGDDGSFVDTEVRGDCLVAGSGVPQASRGSILGADVDPYVAVDNYLGAFRQAAAPVDVVLAVDDNDGIIGLALYGGPADWKWWSGELTGLALSDPRDDDGVTVATLSLRATMARDQARQRSIRAPQPPAPSPSAQPSPRDDPSTAAAAAAPAGAVDEPMVQSLATSGVGQGPGATVLLVQQSTPSPAAPPTVTPQPTSPAPSVATPTPRPPAPAVEVLEVELAVSCTVVR